MRVLCMKMSVMKTAAADTRLAFFHFSQKLLRNFKK